MYNELQQTILDEHIKKSGLTNILYKYLPPNLNRVESLINNTMWFSDWEHLNDPFDCNVLLPKKLSKIDLSAIRNAAKLDKTNFPIEIEKSKIVHYIADKKEMDFLEKAFIWSIQFNKNDVAKLLVNKNIENDKWITSLYSSMLNPIKEMLNQVCIFSLSELKNSKLLWAHYANNFNGFCIGYVAPVNIPTPRIVFKVNYNDVLNMVNPLDIIGDPFSVISKIAITKPIDWSYEYEWRLIQGGFYGLSESMLPIKEIIFGYKLNQDIWDLLFHFFKNHKVIFFEAKPNLKSTHYNIEVKKIA